MRRHTDTHKQLDTYVHTSGVVLLSSTITNLVFERVPPLGVGGEVKLFQGNSHLSQELVPPEAVPVPHTQPESAAQQG